MWYNNDMTENWKPVTGWQGLYDVSDHGRVRSWSRYKNGACLKLVPDRDGYLVSQFAADGRREWFRIHQVVLREFVGPCPDGLQVSHKDGNPQNNSLSNLIYETAKANTARQKAHGTAKVGGRNHNAILTPSIVKQIRGLNGRISQDKIAAICGVSQHTISQAVRGKTWSHI